MTSFIVERVLRGAVTLLTVLMLVFLLVRVAPSDPAAALVPSDASPEMADSVRHLWGLDKPIAEQFVIYVENLLQGNWGDSYQYSTLSAGQAGTPALGLVMSRLPFTVLLAITSLLLSVLIGVPLGMLTALKPGSRLDNAVFTVSMLLTSFPGFFIGIGLIFAFSLWLKVLPTGGSDNPQSLVLPAVTLSLHFAVILTRLTRTELGRVLKSEFITTARAKGLGEGAVFRRHALKNVMIPLVTVIGLRLGHLFNAAVVVETLFRWPGIGKMMVDAIGTRDYPVIQVIVPMGAVLFVTINIAVDLIYGWVDPRVRLGNAK